MTETTLDRAASPAANGAPRTTWVWHPPLPLTGIPVFVWPPRPLDALKYFLSLAFLGSVIVPFGALATLTWTYLQPALERCVTLRLDFYSPADLKLIILRSAELLEIPIDEEAAEVVSMRSRGTPRIANRILRRARDFAEVDGRGHLDRPTAENALSRLGIDELGLDEMDRRILNLLVTNFGGGPVGVETMAVALHETARTIEEVYEPYLIKEGFLERTPRGRAATGRTYDYLKLNPGSASPAQRQMF